MRPLRLLSRALALLLLTPNVALPHFTFAQDTTLTGAVAYESCFVYRGSHLADDIVNPRFQLNTPIYERCSTFISAHYGAWGIFTFDNTENMGAEQINPYAALAVSFNDFMSVEFGYTRYIYTHTDLDGRNFRNHNTSRQNEVFLTLSADLCFHPTVKVFYNFDLRQIVIEPSIAFYVELLDCLTLDIDILGGYLHADRFNGNQLPHNIHQASNTYFYTRAKVDLTYHFTECLSLSAGPRFAINSDDEQPNTLPYGPYTANALSCDRDTFWVGACLSFGF